MRKPLVVGNWKLNGRLAENKNRILALAEAVKNITQVEVGLCLPYVYLFQAQQLLANTGMLWGAQNVSQFVQGAYTACISAEMLAEFGCHLVIVGHSERRHYTAENSQKAVIRIQRAVDAGITPIYCIGETQAEHAAGVAKKVIAAQLSALLGLDELSLQKIFALGLVVAYEPVWAIGTGQAAIPAFVQEMHVFIRRLLAQYDSHFAANVRIIYGGSVSLDNAQSLFAMPDVDGALVGRASLNVDTFAGICAIASQQAVVQSHV